MNLIRIFHFILIYLAAAIHASCGESFRPPKRGQDVAIGGVSKSNQTPFYARLATSDARVIVTSPEQIGMNSIFRVPAEHSLYYAEFLRDNPPQLENEIFREINIVLFTARDEREAFIITKDVEEFTHPRKIHLDALNRPDLENHNDQGVEIGLKNSGVKIDLSQMRQDLESLSGARPIMVDGQSFTLVNRATNDNKTKARAWLRANYEALGYSVIEHRYSSGVNLIAEKKSEHPVDDQIFMVTGHLDTVQTAGADDDGSGVISSLSVARALSEIHIGRTIRFVAFDEEERGLLGSVAYARELQKNGEISKVSVLNIEMTGYDSDNNGDFHTIDCNENSSPQLSRALLSAIAAEGIKLKKVDACTTRSDHAVFWDYNRPAIVISQNFFGGDGNPCYHRTCDTVAKVNFDYMMKMTQAAANAVANLNVGLLK